MMKIQNPSHINVTAPHPRHGGDCSKQIMFFIRPSHGEKRLLKYNVDTLGRCLWLLYVYIIGNQMLVLFCFPIGSSVFVGSISGAKTIDRFQEICNGCGRVSSINSCCLQFSIYTLAIQVYH